MPARTAVSALLLVAALSTPAAAHVVASERENNRYVVLAPLGDRLRMVYTVYIGTAPGARARAAMDRNHDGRVEPGEAQAYGDELGGRVASQVSLRVDGVSQPLRWSAVEVGIDDPSTTAGAFAVDLVAWACFDSPRTDLAHRIELVDHFVIPDPGESELQIQESPGVRITRSELGAQPPADPPRLDFTWMGGPGPAADGYTAELSVDPEVATFVGGPCPGAAATAPSPHRALWAVGGAALAAAALAALIWRLKKKN